MFKIISEIFATKNKSESLTNTIDDNQETLVLQKKIEAHYGEQNIHEQQLFEQWCSKEHWNLKQEAIPLVLGLSPNDTSWTSEQNLKSNVDELYQHALHCIEHDLSLTVINSEAQQTEWQVVPVDFYRWAAVSRVTVPEKLSSLMDFIITTVKTTGFTTDDQTSVISPEASSLSIDFDKQTEIVLGAALNLLAKHPEECKSERGKVVARKIAAQIIESSEHWFGDTELKLAESAVEDIINKWLIVK